MDLDCTNGKRFFVSEGDLSGDKAVAEQDKHFDKSAAIAKCDDAIKRKLNHPATFNQHVTDTSAARNENGNIMIVRGFSAKNGLGIEVDYRANCIISNGRVDLGTWPAGHATVADRRRDCSGAGIRGPNTLREVPGVDRSYPPAS